MYYYEGIFPKGRRLKMNAIIFYSNTSQSKAVADLFLGELHWDSYDLNNRTHREWLRSTSLERAILVFPIYCQGIPKAVEEILEHLQACYLTVVATYGKMCYARVIYEIQERYTAGEIIAAAYIPTKHSYVNEETAPPDIGLLKDLIKKNISAHPSQVLIERTYKNPLSNVCRDMRSRAGIKIIIDKSKCESCKKCENECLYGGIRDGKVTSTCIRCLKCVTNCPSGALTYRPRLPMRLYLKKKRINEIKIYI